MTGFASTEDFHALRDSTSPLSDSRPRTPTPPPGFTSPLPPNSNGHSLASLNGDKVLPVDATPTLAAADLPAQDSVEDRPSKRRRVAVNDDTTTNSDGAFNGAVTPTRNSSARKKIESPPWKNAAAEGPTTIVENGRRKSGRISTVQLLQRNITALNSPPPLPSSPALRRGSRTESTPSTAVKQNASSNPPPSSTGRRSARSTSIATNAHQATPTTRPARRGSIARESRAPSRASRRRSPSPTPQPTRQSSRTTRTAPRISLVSRSLAIPNKPRRASIRTLRNAPILHTEVPLVHPGQVPLRKRIGPSFEEFWDMASSRPVEEGGLFTPEDGPSYTDEMATRDAQAIIRIEEELEPGGLLSQERCSLFAPENVEEPSRQWAHYDHLIKAAQNIRRLMIAEQTRHRLTAKKLAEACRDEWLRRQPKSDQQLETEARARNIAKYRIVTRSIAGMWENVRGEVNRRRLARWEAEEQKRVKAALNEAVNISEQKLQARRTTMDEGESDAEDIITNSPSAHNLGDDIDMMTDSAESATENENDVNHSESDATTLDDDDMSDSVDESDDGLSSFDNDERKTEVDDDEILTPDQLRAKYADLPKISHKAGTEADAIVIKADDAETSDESVDMDDDLGSSDMSETGSENGSINGNVDDNDDSDSDGESDGATGLLGMLFGKQELRNFKQEETPDDTQSNAASEAPLTALTDTNGRSATPVVATSPMAIENSEQVDLGTMAHDSTNRGSTEPASTSQNTKPTFDAPYSNTSPETRHEARTATPLSTEPASVPTPMEIDEPRDNTDPPTSITTLQQSNTQVATQDPSVQVVSSVEPAEDKVYQSVQELIVSPNPTSESRELSTVPTEAVPKTEIPFLLRGTLREYQHYGLDWLAGLYANNTNGILADEMGLGKTIQTISLLAHLACHHGIWGPHLVVVPTSVMLNWEMEFKKWCPGFKIMAYYGSIEERRRKRHGWNNNDLWNVCITSYQLVLQDNQVFRRRKWHYLILDEAHNIKNFKSLRWQTLLGFNTQARLLITGTPLQNNLTELWSLLFFLMPSENGVGGFADLQEFHDWFAKPESQILESGKEQLDEEGRAIISKLHKVLRPYLLRRLKADVEKQMPAKYEHVVFCRLSKRQRELYDGFLARSDTRATLAGGNYLSIINCLMQLRKVCNHPDLFVDRPIQTSLRLEKSVPSEFALTSKIVKDLCFTTNLASSVSLSFLNLVPTKYERTSSEHALRISELCAQDELMSFREAQKERALLASTTLNPTTVESSISFLEGSARWGRFEELQHCVYLNALRCQQKPIYGKNLTDFLTLDLGKRPRIQRPRDPQKLMEWFENKSFLLESIVKDVSQRSEELETTIQKFACVTPAVVSRDMPELLLGSRCVAAFKEKDFALSTPVRWSPFIPPERPLDPWHEARIRLSIQFPDKRLLQYDCGKLQALDKLLRKLQSGGHRALIFTQMTRVLDILEQFLNIHGHKYLRLDGATKVEQRQLLTDRFNSDKRILCFILSTRSGGLGINLTGADTVIFYDQDWNPAMDKQCQDRCHRIGQTRDVHIYRLVSEHTIESNILRKASQKQMLDDVVIQDGGFTTDYFNRVKVQDALDEDDPEADLQNGIAAASAAMDRVLGCGTSGNSSAVGHQFEQVEDREDVTAARVAEKEIQDDEADFSERAVRDDSQSQSLRPSEPPSESPVTPIVADLAGGIEVVAENDFNFHGKPMKTIDDFMLDCMGWMLEGVPLEIPKDKKKNKGRKRGKDMRRR